MEGIDVYVDFDYLAGPSIMKAQIVKHALTFQG
jgi:hypothetical protein